MGNCIGSTEQIEQPIDRNMFDEQRSIVDKWVSHYIYDNELLSSYCVNGQHYLVISNNMIELLVDIVAQLSLLQSTVLVKFPHLCDNHYIEITFRKKMIYVDFNCDNIIQTHKTFGKEFTENLLSVILPNCDRFISRSFLNPNWSTKYAVYFPKAEELTPFPFEHPINEVYTFYIWNNKQS